MTIQSQVNKAQFFGTGSTGPFTFVFFFYNNDEITVILTDTDGSDTTLVENVDYTLSGANVVNGGSVVLAAALASGQTLTISRYIDITQETAFTNLGAFFAVLHEDAFDRLTMICQQLYDMAKRAIKMPESWPTDATLPKETYVNGVIGFDINGVLRLLPPLAYSIVVTAGAAGAATVVHADAGTGNVTVDITALSEVYVTKQDDTAYTVTIIDSAGLTIGWNASYILGTQGEFVHLVKNTTDWVRIG